MPSQTILLAYPEEWHTISDGISPADYFRNKGFDVITAFSYGEALEIVQSQGLCAVVMTSEWAMRADNGSPGLMKFLRNKIPTMSLITTTTYRSHDNWLDELFDPRQHEYQHMPADIDAIVMWLNQIINNEI